MEKVLQVLEGFDASHTLALINALGGRDIALDIAAGKKKVAVEDVIQLLIDQNGRGIPFPGMKGVVDADRSFYLTQPSINYTEVLGRLQEFYGQEYEFMSAEEFQKRCEVALAYIKGEPSIANLLNGPHFIFALPKLTGDLGTILDNTIVPAMERAYLAQFPDRSFTNYCHNDLAKKVKVVTGTRQERLVHAMAQGPVCGVFFPALQGFSIPADREFIAKMPERLTLAGMEVPVAVTAHPDTLFRDWYTPGLDMASLQWQSREFSLRCGANDDEAGFGCGDLHANGLYSGGVSILG